MGKGLMKKIILLGIILAVFILLIAPSTSAVKYNVAVEENKLVIIEKIQNVFKEGNIDLGLEDLPLWLLILLDSILFVVDIVIMAKIIGFTTNIAFSTSLIISVIILIIYLIFHCIIPISFSEYTTSN